MGRSWALICRLPLCYEYDQGINNEVSVVKAMTRASFSCYGETGKAVGVVLLQRESEDKERETHTDRESETHRGVEAVLEEKRQKKGKR